MKRLLALIIGFLIAMVLVARGEDVRVDLNRGMLDVFVQDPEGHPVLNLGAGDFEITANGENIQIDHFSIQREPLALGIVVDRSSSIDPFRKEIDRAVTQLVGEMGASDQAFLITFAGTNSINVPLTNRHKDILDALHKVPGSYGTRFYDAVVDSLRYLDTAEAPRKALVVFSDAADHFSERSFQDVLRAARRFRHPVYFFGYVGDDSRTWTMEGRGRIQEELGQIAAVTGGKAIFPGPGVNCSRIAADIVSSVGYVYKIAFYSPLRFVKPGSVRVQLSGERLQGYRVRFIQRAFFALPQESL